MVDIERLMKFFKSNVLLFTCGIAVMLVVTAVFFVSGDAEATAVRGRCDGCHTMHNSQDGTGMVVLAGAKEISAGQDLECTGCHGEPREELLRLSCIGCHAMDRTGTGDATVDWGGFDVPQVVYDTSVSLAAGNFYYMFTQDETGHNIHGFDTDIPPDTPISLNPPFDPNYPPGYEPLMDPAQTNKYTDSTASQILCSGTYGCHGSREIESPTRAMAGTHHADDSVLELGHANFDASQQGLTQGTSYRYLSGIKGGEVVGWEEVVTRQSHNEYYGQTIVDGGRTTTTQSWSDVDTMSEFCASCHGNFHMNSGVADEGMSTTAASPWIRHPTDVEIPDAPPYDSYVSYELTARVARAILPSDPLDTTGLNGSGGGTAIVFCLSCHRAHASSEWDALRFSYVEMITGGGAGSGEGCLACHSDKD